MAEPASPIAADLLDERLIEHRASSDMPNREWNRLRSGELGSVPVVFGLVIISIVFYSAEPIFLSSRNLVSIMQFAAPIGVISLGIVLVLLLGEIDLSVGSVSGCAAASMTVLVVRHEQSMALGLLVGVAGGGGGRTLLRLALHPRWASPASCSRWRASWASRACCSTCLGRKAPSTSPGTPG